MTDELNPNLPIEQVAPAPAPSLPPQGDPEFDAFQAQLQRYLGFGVADLVGSVETVRKLAAEREATTLRNQWGSSYDENFAAVQTRLNELHATNPTLAASLNNAQGAQLIHAQLTVERQQAGAPTNVPSFHRTSSPGLPASSRAMFTQTEILAMPKAVRSERHAEITAAYAQGLVSPE